MQWYFFLCFLLLSCDTTPQDAPVRSEYIYRKSNEKRIGDLTPKKITKKDTSFTEIRRDIPPITKEYFRCKGSSLHPPKPHQIRGKEVEPLTDCNGSERHSLPIKGGQEYIYPVLIEILNHIQYCTNKAIVITSGHRCITHNTYVNPSVKNMASKHLIGAEVDFYVRGFETNPERVIQMIQDFYTKHPRYQHQKEYIEFLRYERETDVSCKPWFNKEIFIKLYQQDEGRNIDNRHLYPYISIQVRFDRDRNLRVIFDWQDARQVYHR